METSRFARFVHDCANILTAIRGHGEILVENLPPGVDRDDAREIVNATERLGSLLDSYALAERVAQPQPDAAEELVSPKSPGRSR